MNHITVAVILFLQMPGQHPEQAGLSFEFMQWIVAHAVSLPETRQPFLPAAYTAGTGMEILFMLLFFHCELYHKSCSGKRA